MDPGTSKKKGKKDPEHSTGHAEESNHMNNNWYIKWRQKWKDMTAANKLIVFFTGVIAICTLVYAVVSAFQLEAVIDSNKINRDALTSVQRAFLDCPKITQSRSMIADNSGTHGIWTFFAPCTNTGATSANITAYAVSSGLFITDPSDSVFAGASPTFNSIDVGPRGTRDVEITQIKDKALAGEELPNNPGDWSKFRFPPIMNKSLANYYFWGWVSYRDVFKDTDLHITEFCAKLTTLNINRYDLQNPFFFSYSSCATHNCDDQYCDDYKTVAGIALRRIEYRFRVVLPPKP
jgi:hypothetical protein